MTLSLAEIIAARKLESKEEPVLALYEDDSDLFLLTDSSEGKQSGNLKAFLHLVYASAHKTNLIANDLQNLRALATWLGPFPCSHLPYYEPVPKFLQSFMLWRISEIINIQPGKLWKVLLEVLIEAEEKNT